MSKEGGETIHLSGEVPLGKRYLQMKRAEPVGSALEKLYVAGNLVIAVVDHWFKLLGIPLDRENDGSFLDAVG